MLKLYILLLLTSVGCGPLSQPAGITQQFPNPPETSAIPTTPAQPSTSCLSAALRMNVPHAAHTATLLPNGKVLIAGGFQQEGTREIAIADAELFDPATNRFITITPMNEPRNGHTATLLSNGQVLIVGGWNRSGRSSTAELYDPQTDTFSYTGSLMAPRQGMTATLLENGLVLIAGGDSARNTSQFTAELYDPVTGTFSPTGDLNYGRMAHSATLLKDGSVLLVGGGSSGGNVRSDAEIYDPQTGTFSLSGTTSRIRYKHSAVRLPDGNVLILGGSSQKDWAGRYESAELYDAQSGNFSEIAPMHVPRFKLADAAVLLPNGNVLIAGGHRQIEIYDTRDRSFARSDSLDDDYFYAVSTLLDSGQVLITGGYDPNIQPSDKAWLFCGV